jgi:hypothetical protein
VTLCILSIYSVVFCQIVAETGFQTPKLDDCDSVLVDIMGLRVTKMIDVNCQGIGDSAMAYQCLRNALASNNDHSEAYNNLGVLESRKGRYEMARAFFQASFNISRHLFEPHYNYALLADKVSFYGTLLIYGILVWRVVFSDRLVQILCHFVHKHHSCGMNNAVWIKCGATLQRISGFKCKRPEKLFAARSNCGSLMIFFLIV